MIKLENISKSYFRGDVETKILQNISFEIKSGEFVAITGPSGSGKSTLMNILGALDSPTGGRYLFDSKDVSNFSEDDLALLRRQKIGFVFQSFNLLSRATVLRNVTLPLVYAEIPATKREKIAQEALKAVDLPSDRWHHLSNQLSGGQMQRVAIARALVNNPVLILADEPTGNLDSKTGQIVLQTFKDLNKKEKRTIVLITHDREIAAHADRIIYLKDGEIVEDKKIKH
jgi:putative ABC transport system ATP-binding protein